MAKLYSLLNRTYMGPPIILKYPQSVMKIVNLADEFEISPNYHHCGISNLDQTIVRISGMSRLYIMFPRTKEVHKKPIFRF